MWGWPAFLLGVFILITSYYSNWPKIFTSFHLNLIGILCLLIGGISLLYGMWRRGPLEERRSQFPESPWLGDRGWNPKGASDGTLQGIGKCLLGLGALIVYLLILHFADPGTPFRLSNPAVWYPFFPGFVCLAFGGIFVHQYVKNGVVFLRFEHFPFRLGERLELTLDHPYLFSQYDEFEVALRCVEEKEGTYHRFGKHKGEVECDQVYEDVFLFKKGEDYSDKSSSVPIEFNLPQEGKPTSMMKKPVVYWEIELKYTKSESDYSISFLVPVY